MKFKVWTVSDILFNTLSLIRHLFFFFSADSLAVDSLWRPSKILNGSASQIKKPVKERQGKLILKLTDFVPEFSLLLANIIEVLMDFFFFSFHSSWVTGGVGRGSLKWLLFLSSGLTDVMVTSSTNHLCKGQGEGISLLWTNHRDSWSWNLLTNDLWFFVYFIFISLSDSSEKEKIYVENRMSWDHFFFYFSVWSLPCQILSLWKNWPNPLCVVNKIMI